MKGKKAAVMDKVRPDLLVLPHVVGKLINILADEWQPDLFQQEQLTAHFVECPYCRTAFIVVLLAEQEYEKSIDYPDSPVDELLTRLVNIHHEIESHEYEYMGEYAEAIVSKGKEEANRRFPVLTEHISKCPLCQIRLKKILAFLNESEEAD